uniref:Uncharacterized protein n=1 Tax=Lankesteria abbotti TaxID=340204 RepID=A0A7S2VUI0_9APIC
MKPNLRPSSRQLSSGSTSSNEDVELMSNRGDASSAAWEMSPKKRGHSWYEGQHNRGMQVSRRPQTHGKLSSVSEKLGRNIQRIRLSSGRKVDSGSEQSVCGSNGSCMLSVVSSPCS